MQKARYWGGRGWEAFCIGFTLAMFALGMAKAAGWF